MFVPLMNRNYQSSESMHNEESQANLGLTPLLCFDSNFCLDLNPGLPGLGKRPLANRAGIPNYKEYRRLYGNITA